LNTASLQKLAKIHDWFPAKTNRELLVATAEDLEVGMAFVKSCNDFVLSIVDKVFPYDLDDISLMDRSGTKDGLLAAAASGMDLWRWQILHDNTLD
jgi:hypothetical protein